MLTLREKQLFILFVTGVSMVLAADENKGPFGTRTEYSEGPCLSPEPKGVDKVNEKLKDVLETEGFSVAMCSQTYAAIMWRICDGYTGVMNRTDQFSGKYGTNRQDIALYFSTSISSEPSGKMKCEVVSVAKKKCYDAPDKKFTSTLTTIWGNEKFMLVVGCTSDGHKFWAVFAARVAIWASVPMTDDEKNNIFKEVEKLGFKRTKAWW